ncbi:DUF6443 domain-containing protein [Aquimarina algiphila]|uniref:DUF6443 domain-containing protein n=1 Tax=Aquimarina algiphila TaxID=2047982 RepID=A0A554VM53_9FLAO|nr:DUF6443 domain-containing protein [Aquimarina algiphila]TSE09321.1 hypothetical protein FOF46_08675 [Aquimarina algiphila]
MKYIHKIIALLTFLVITHTYGQLGIENVDNYDPISFLNQERSYTVVTRSPETFVPRGDINNWQVYGGVITHFNATTDAITVRWTSVGQGYLLYTGLQQWMSGTSQDPTPILQEKIEYTDKNITVKDPDNMATYAGVAVSYIDCYTAVLKTNADIPNGRAWYWQLTPNGTSTTMKIQSRLVKTGNGRDDNEYEADETIVYESGNYYLRYYDTTSQTWGGALPLNVDLVAGSANQISVTQWYTDIDNDGFGDPASVPITVTGCAKPTGYVDNNLDMCPTEAGENQGCATTNYRKPLLSNHENYVYTAVPQIPIQDINTISKQHDVIEGVTYYDGLGRTIKSIAIGQSPKGNDMVQIHTYDYMGRQKQQFLPYTSTTNGGSFLQKTNQENVTHDVREFYQEYLSDQGESTPYPKVVPYSESLYDNTPGSRPLQQAAPGYDWHMGSGHEVKFDRGFNAANEVRKYKVSYTGNSLANPTLVEDGFYAYKELQKSTVTDEDGKTIETFVNQQGQTVLSRKAGLDTYSIYDDYGNLSFVLSPKVKVTDGISAIELAELGYQYKYNSSGAVIEKKDPGKGLESTVYNDLGQPVLVQSAKLKAEHKWLFTKYDFLGRVIYTGMYTDSSTRSALQTMVSALPINALYESKTTSPIAGFENQLYYTNTVFPTNITELHTINYYDTYEFDRTSKPEAIAHANVYGEVITQNTQDFATGTKEKVLGTHHWITSVIYYDNDGSAVYTFSDNPYLQTTDVVKLQLDFTGKLLKSRSYHKKGTNAEIVTQQTFTYDHAGRLLDEKQCIGDNSLSESCGEPTQTTTEKVEIVARNSYDELGQLENKKVGGTVSASGSSNGTLSGVEGLQTIDYKYNIRGWLTHINDPDADLGDDLFACKVAYTKTNLQNGPSSFSIAYYNGNISSTHWKTSNDNKKYGYMYGYDAHNRLTESVFFKGDLIDPGVLSESFSFDKNGNITGGFRENHQGGTVDYLQYTYDSGNKLLKVADLTGNPEGFKEGINSGNDYAYDIDGNMTQDLNKGITNIIYNHLNLPTQITVVQGSQTSTTQMVYTAGGSKLSKTTTVNNTPKTTQYAGTFVYTDTNTYPEYIHFSEGYIEPVIASGSAAISYTYIYQYTDHLGNVRLSYADDNGDGMVDASEIREEKHYYAFGLQHNYGSSDPRSIKRGRKHNYGFNGIELNEDLGIDLYEMPLRSYDPAIARWTAQDLVVHFMYSPYSAFDNNPVYYADPSGADSYSSAQDYFANYNMTDSYVPAGFSYDPFGSNTDVFYGTNPTYGQGGIVDQNYAAYRESQALTAQYGRTYSVSAGDLNPWTRYFASEANRIGGVLASLENSTNSIAGAATNGAISSVKDFWSGIGDSVSGVFSNPWEAWKQHMGAGGWKNFIPGYTAYSATIGRTIGGLQTASSVGSSLARGNYYGAGRTYGGFLGGTSLELGLTVATGGVARGLSGSSIGRVFWVGEGSQSAAQAYALKNGMKTLDMTWYGRAGVGMERLLKPISPYLNRKMWDGLSYVFARNANGPVFTMFGTYRNTGIHMSNISSRSTWFRVEYPTLTKYGKEWTPLLTPK